MKTEVIFRKEGGGVVAFMPYDIADLNGNITCYAHIGQHSAASLGYYRTTKSATEKEYFDLLNELQSIGYDVQVRQRMNLRKYSQVCQKIRL
jgi:predicted nucleic acid-binding Zn finger protein